MIRFLATGDLQVHAWKQFSRIENGMNSRLLRILEVFDFLLKTAEERGIKKILLNGDIFEESDYIPVETYIHVFRKLRMLTDSGMEVVVVLGNHDIHRFSSSGVVSSLESLSEICTVIDEPTVLWQSVAAIPYDSNPKKLRRAARELPENYGGHLPVLAMHVGISGAKTGPTSRLIRSQTKLEDISPEKYSLVILSDFHTEQFLTEKVFYLGSPLQHSFGETHSPGIWEISVQGNEATYEKIPTPFPRFIRLSVSRDSLDSLRNKKLIGNYVSVEHPKSVAPELVESIASETGYLVKPILKMKIQKLENQTKILGRKSIRVAMRKYAESNANNSDVRRLLSVGAELLR